MNAIWNLEKTKKGARATCFIKHRNWTGDDEVNELKSTEDGCEVGQLYYAYTRNGKLVLEKTDEKMNGNGYTQYQSGDRIIKTNSVGTVRLMRIRTENKRAHLYFY